MEKKIAKKEKNNLILICGERESYESLRELNSVLRELAEKNLDVQFLKRGNLKDEDDLPLDEVFVEIARNRTLYKEIVVIMLSGNPGEGYIGLQEIFKKDALCIIEKQENYSESEQHFLTTPNTHLIIDIHETGEILKLYFDHPEETRSFFDPVSKHIWETLKIYFKKKSLDIEVYRKEYIFKLFLERYKSLNIDFKSYYKLLKKDNQEFEDIYDSFNLHKSKFFERSELYEEFKNKIFPELLKNTQKEKTLKIWLSGTGTGEEAYSLCLVIYDYLQNQKVKKKFQIFANDAVLIGFVVNTLRRNKFKLEGLKKIPKEYHKYLDIYPEHFKIKSEISGNIIFSTNNLLTGTGFYGMDLILCQNVANNWKKVWQESIWEKFSVALKKNGILIMEGKTNIPKKFRDNFLDESYSQTNLGNKINLKNTFFKCIKRSNVSKYLAKNAHFDRQDEIEKQLRENQESYKESLNKMENLQQDRSKKKKVSPSPSVNALNKENERLLNENERLKKELDHTKKSLRVASDSYQSTFEEQLKSSIKLKKANHDLSQLKDHLLTLVNERTESLKKEMKLTEQVTENFNELAVVKADLENSKENLEKIKLKLEEKVKERTLELERKNDRLKEYDYTVAHDLINPIGMILSYIDLHAHSKTKGKERTDEILEKIRFASEKSMDIINGILENLIVEKVDLEKNNLIEILDFSLEQLQVKMEEKNAMIKRDLEVEELMCNDISLTQVFANIISNSLKYSKEDERVVIEIASFIKGNNIYITIKDNGIGIKENKLPLIFDKRERAVAEGSEVKGYGIGLYNVRRMVEDNNGQIEAKSELNVGTTFTLIFPIDKK